MLTQIPLRTSPLSSCLLKCPYCGILPRLQHLFLFANNQQNTQEQNIHEQHVHEQNTCSNSIGTATEAHRNETNTHSHVRYQGKHPRPVERQTPTRYLPIKRNKTNKNRQQNTMASERDPIERQTPTICLSVLPETRAPGRPSAQPPSSFDASRSTGLPGITRGCKVSRHHHESQDAPNSSKSLATAMVTESRRHWQGCQESIVRNKVSWHRQITWKSHSLLALSNSTNHERSG